MKKKVLWASRHELDPIAKSELEMIHGEVEAVEILWPEKEDECINLAYTLLNHYKILAGVWPGQAVEAFRKVLKYDGGRSSNVILSPVSVPEKDIDVKKVRPFRFVRWAILL